MVVFFLKFLVLAACFGVAAGLGGLAFWLAGRSWVVFAAVSWLVLAAVAVVIVQGVAWAFERFDVSVDTPA